MHAHGESSHTSHLARHAAELDLATVHRKHGGLLGRNTGARTGLRVHHVSSVHATEVLQYSNRRRWDGFT